MKFEKDYFGRGPKELHTFIVNDMIMVRQRGVLTLAEEQLSDNAEGCELIRRLREKLLKNNSAVLESIIQEITGCKVIAIFTDISVEHSEKMLVFTLDQNLEKKVSKRSNFAV